MATRSGKLYSPKFHELIEQIYVGHTDRLFIEKNLEHILKQVKYHDYRPSTLVSVIQEIFFLDGWTRDQKKRIIAAVFDTVCYHTSFFHVHLKFVNSLRNKAEDLMKEDHDFGLTQLKKVNEHFN